jgi:hypothetical protein
VVVAVVLVDLLMLVVAVVVLEGFLLLHLNLWLHQLITP